MAYAFWFACLLTCLVQFTIAGKIGYAQTWLSFIILLAVLVLIATEIIHRTLAAFGGAFVTLLLLLAVV